MKYCLLTCRYGFTLLLCLFIFTNAHAQREKSEEIVNASEYSLDCLTPPEGFVKGEGVNAFVHWSTQSSILVTLVPNKNIVDAEEAMSEEYFSQQGVTLISKENVQTESGEDALLYKFSFKIKEDTWYRYSLFLGNLNNVLWVNGSYLAKYESVVQTPIIESLKTTKFLK